MSDHSHQQVDPNLLEEMGYEHSDVNIKTTSWSIVWFFIASTLIMFVGLLVLAFFAPKMNPLKSPPAMPERVRKPADEMPLVQSNATAMLDMKDYMSKQGSKVDGYQWTDRKNGFASVPIEDAMRAVEEEGLPTRANPMTYGGPK